MTTGLKIAEPFSHSKKLYYSLLAVWFVVNLLQSYFTELLHDEAYYYFYSTNLAWGYYDHPPMIALLIKLGTLFAKNELGVRVLICAMSVVTIAIMAELAQVKNYLLYFAVVFSIFILHVGGFIAVPDTPLIFFTAVFLYVFRNYLKRDRWIDVLLVSIAIAGLLYSKYLGLLVIFFAFIVNLKLVKRKTFWAILLLSALAMLPHLFWQINNDFVTFYFHLTERSRDASFDFMNIVDFVLGQIAILNPLIGVVLIYYAFKAKAKDEFSRTLQATAFGVLLVGLILAFFSHVEANWTATAFIPLIILAYPLIEENTKIRKPVFIIGTISLLVVVVLRIYLVYDFIPNKRESTLQGELHGWDEWAVKVKEVAGDRPVVFANSYQKPSKYMFYAGQEAFTFNYLLYRKNQFDLGSVEADLFDKEVVFFYENKRIWLSKNLFYKIPRVDSVQIMGSRWFYTTIENYRSYNFLTIRPIDVADEMIASTSIELQLEIVNPLPVPVELKQSEGETFLSVAFTQGGKVISLEEVENISGLIIDEKYLTTIKVKTPEIPGEYNLRVIIRSGWFPPGLNSRIQKIKVLAE